MGIMKTKKRGEKVYPGYFLLALGVLVIFTSSMLNALHSGHFDAGSSLSHRVYILDLISTLGVIIIPWGLYGIMKKNEPREPEPLSFFSTFDKEQRSHLQSHRD
jgi:hypothetical protein